MAETALERAHRLAREEDELAHRAAAAARRARRRAEAAAARLQAGESDDKRDHIVHVGRRILDHHLTVVEGLEHSELLHRHAAELQKLHARHLARRDHAAGGQRGADRPGGAQSGASGGPSNDMS
jgi:hypothetical protein